jgi:hypothetical protein
MKYITVDSGTRIGPHPICQDRHPLAARPRPSEIIPEIAVSRMQVYNESDYLAPI